MNRDYLIMLMLASIPVAIVTSVILLSLYTDPNEDRRMRLWKDIASRMPRYIS
jgi:hypothetical protein